MNKAFWKELALTELTAEQWESLCDGCAQCCLVKLEDEDSGEVFRTSVSCKLLDTDSCQCRDYENRFKLVSECVEVTLEKPEQFEWMPETCAYRLLYEGKSLFSWHPLISGSRNSVHEAGISVQGFALSEEYVHPEQLEEFILESLNNAEN